MGSSVISVTCPIVVDNGVDSLDWETSTEVTESLETSAVEGVEEETNSLVTYTVVGTLVNSLVSSTVEVKVFSD